MASWMMIKSADVPEAGAGEKKTAFRGPAELHVSVNLPPGSREVLQKASGNAVVPGCPAGQPRATGASTETPTGNSNSVPPAPSTNNAPYHASRPKRNAHRIRLHHRKPGKDRN